MTPSPDPKAAYRIHDLLAHYAAATPDAEAVVEGRRRLDYAGLAAGVAALSRAMITAGIKAGDRVASLGPPGIDPWIACLAAGSIGAIWVGLNPRYRIGELHHLLDDAEPTLLFVGSAPGGLDAADALAPLLADRPNLRLVTSLSGFVSDDAVRMEAFVAAGSSVAPEALAERCQAVQPRDACLLVFTSGSTGTPKGALLQHEGIAAFALNQNAIWPLDPFRILNFLPINHIGFTLDIAVSALAAGGAMVFLSQFDPAASLAIMEAERITLWGSVPSVFRLQLDHPDFATTDLSAVKLIVWGGAAMGLDLIERLAPICPVFATNYGMTETSSAITTVAPTSDHEVLSRTVGLPFPEVEIRLMGDVGLIDVPGVAGEVTTRSRLNFLGYWRNPSATAAAFDSDGFFRTGDIGMWHPDGTLTLVGRIKEMYKSGGYNVYPLEIEAIVEDHPAVATCAVVGMPDPLWQEVGCAFVLLSGQVDEHDLRSWCQDRLANYKVPKRFVVVDVIPLLPIGKIDKPALRHQAKELAQTRG